MKTIKTPFFTKATLSLALIGSLSLLSANPLTPKIETLKGDTATACEVLLCLASPIKPPECHRSLARYFAIKFKKPWKTIQARKDFLKLCPVDKSDSQMNYYVTEVLPYVEEECTTFSLNKRVEIKKDAFKERQCKYIQESRDDGFYMVQKCSIVNKEGFRINPNLPRSCTLLASSAYTDYRLKNTCDNKFYTKEEWESGKEIISEISKTEFEALPLGQRLSLQKWEKQETNYGRNRWNRNKNKYEYTLVTKYYQTKPIKKDCWINDK